MSNGDGKRSSRNAWRRRSYSRAVRGKGDEALPTLGTATAAAATLVERPAVHAVPGTAEVTQDGGRDVDVADRVTARAGAEAAAPHEQKRPLLVDAEAAVLSEARVVLTIDVFDDVAVAANAERVHAVLRAQRDRRRQLVRGQPHAREVVPGEDARDPLLAAQELREVVRARLRGGRAIDETGGAVGRHHDVARVGRLLEPGLHEQA